MRKNGRLKPDLAILWNNKGAEFVKFQRYDEAKRAFNQATEIKPDLVPAWFNLANLYAMEGKREEALTKLKRAVKTDPDFKKTAQKASCFKELWNDKDFKRLMN